MIIGLRILYSILVSLIVLTATAQSKFELSYLTKADQHGHYTTRFFTRSYTNDMHLMGISRGVNIQYKHPVVKQLYLTVGLGNYRLGVQKVKSIGPFGSSDTRIIDYTHPSGIKPAFHTKRYAYNNLQFNAGLEYQTKEKTGRSFSFGANVLYYQSFSQKYRIEWDGGIKHKTNNWRMLGYGIDAHVGIIQRLKNREFYFHPKIVIPIYQQLRGDEAFGEPPSMRIGKFFNGIGYSISIGKEL